MEGVVRPGVGERGILAGRLRNDGVVRTGMELHHDHDLFGGRDRACGWERNLRETGAKTRPSTTTRSEQRVIVARRGVFGPPAIK